jgi:hypothetical protein
MYKKHFFRLQYTSPRRNSGRWRSSGGRVYAVSTKTKHQRGGNLGMESFCLFALDQGKPTNRRPAPANTKCLGIMASACLALTLAACASAPHPAPTPPEPAPQVVSMEEWMARARQAASEGHTEKTRDAYRSAAQNYPTEKMPWLKLSEDYFNAQDYGHAVLAAQEALQRDTQDALAHSILAVSGLRLTAGSLVALRQEASLPVGSRDEAISVARALRDTLGATSLLAPPAQANANARARKPAPAPTAAVSTQRPAGVATAPAAPAAAAVVPTSATPTATPSVVAPAGAPVGARTPAPKPAGNPFDKLK